MLQPNDLPLVCLPIDLSDEAAVALEGKSYRLKEAKERAERKAKTRTKQRAATTAEHKTR